MLVLVTGFEGWGGLKENPSGIIARGLNGREIDGAKVVGLQISDDFYEVQGSARNLVSKYRPDAVISTGWDFTNRIKVEKVALNIMDSLYNGVRVPDSGGHHPTDEQVVASAPLAYRATLPVEEIVNALNKAGIPAIYSYHACVHGCNAIMYSFLHYVREAGSEAPAGHIHVMPTPEMLTDERNSEHVRATAASMDLDRQVRAIEIAVGVTVRKLVSSTPRLRR